MAHYTKLARLVTVLAMALAAGMPAMAPENKLEIQPSTSIPEKFMCKKKPTPIVIPERLEICLVEVSQPQESALVKNPDDKHTPEETLKKPFIIEKLSDDQIVTLCPCESPLTRAFRNPTPTTPLEKTTQKPDVIPSTSDMPEKTPLCQLLLDRKITKQKLLKHLKKINQKERTAYVNQVDPEGTPALLYALTKTRIMRDPFTCIKMLIAAGANTFVRDRNGENALTHAVLGKHKQELIEYLMSLNIPPYKEVEGEKIALSQQLIELSSLFDGQELLWKQQVHRCTEYEKKFPDLIPTSVPLAPLSECDEGLAIMGCNPEDFL